MLGINVSSQLHLSQPHRLTSQNLTVPLSPIVSFTFCRNYTIISKLLKLHHDINQGPSSHPSSQAAERDAELGVEKSKPSLTHGGGLLAPRESVGHLASSPGTPLSTL